MELKQLYYFRIVAQYEHITHAADFLHISQPSLSATISRLERELGTELFTRTSNRITLNENGRIFLRYVNRMCTELNHGITEIRRNQAASRERIDYCTFGPGISYELIPTFLISHPHVSISHTIATHEEMLSGLSRNTFDFALSCIPTRSGDYDWYPLFTDHLLILMSINHPLSGKHSVDLKDLSHERFAIFNADTYLPQVSIQLCHEAGFDPDIIYNGNEISLILALVAANQCVFLCQASNGVFGNDDPRTSMSKISISHSLCVPGRKIDVGITIRKNRELSPAAKEYIEVIRSAYTGALTDT